MSGAHRNRSRIAADKPLRISHVLCTLVLVYLQSKVSAHCVVERVQMGVRIEKRLLKVMKALAECHGVTLGDLIE